MARPFRIHVAKVTSSKKPPANKPGRLLLIMSHESATIKLTLACLEARLGLVDDISPATAANHAVVAMAALERLQRINDFHRIYPSLKCMKLELKARSYGWRRPKSSAKPAFLRFSGYTSLAIIYARRKDMGMKTIIRLFPLLALASLSACVVPTGPVEVTRFNRAAEGVGYGSGSYSVAVAGDSVSEQGLAVSPYVAAVAREMQRIGYAERTANSDVTAEVRVSTERFEPDRRSPVSVGVGGSTGSYGSGVGLGVGINLGGGPKAQVETTLSVRIVRRSDNLVIWEGKATQVAKSGSPAAQAGIAASKLAEAMFKDFPGVSGETIRVP